MPGPFRWSDELVRILGVRFGPDLPLEWNWSEIQAKGNAQVGTRLPRRLSLKSRAEVCAVYIFPWFSTDCLYFLCLGIVGWRCNNPPPDYSGEVEGRWSVVRSAFNVQAMVVWVWGGLGMPDLESHWLAEKLAHARTRCEGEKGVGLFLASSQTQRPKVDVGRWAQHRLSANAVRFFVTFPGPVTVNSPRKNCIGNWWWAPLRTRERHGWTTEKVRSYWNWVPGSGFLNNSEFSLNWQLARKHVDWLRSLQQWLGRNGWAHLLQLRAGSPVLGSRLGVHGLHRTQTARAARRWLRRGQSFGSVSGWELCGVSREPSCCQNDDLDDAKEEIIWRCKLFSLWFDIVVYASAYGQDQMS